MKKVKDLILYQVATDRHYRVGDILTFGKEMNVQGQRTFNTAFTQDNIAWHEKGFEYADSKRIFNDKNLVIALSKNLAEADFVIRELAIESARKQFAPTAPSRLTAMFLTAKKEKVLEGVELFYKKGFGSFFQAVAVKLNGVIHIGYKGIVRFGKSYQEYYDLGKQYWTQPQDKMEGADEILFEGKAEVVEIFKEVQR